ncbi:MAG: DNA sulfur modification protein DndD [Thermodesulfovibrionales bacterium]|nr:DNA sulfur modification protein DndD [Thermodesulfovibrionales bacterium]
MIINKIGLCNFGSFEGEIQLDISISNPEKNVILIGGKNGAGKTTLFTAIKLGLYGPIALGYDTTSSSYYRRVKRLINKNSLSKKDVNTYVLLDFKLEEERELANYILTRQWRYEDQKLIESFGVERNGKILSEEEIESFENYIKSLIPPQLFDLFFFDGEKISDFFLEGNTSKNLKEALLLLCGYDTFDTMASNFKRILHKGNDELLDDEEKKVSELLEEKEKIQKSVEFENTRLLQIDNEINNLDEKQQQLEKEFRNAGGLLAQEIAKLQNDILREEKFREEKNEWLKEFANDSLPFIIANNLVKEVKQQINKERGYQKYKTIKESLNNEFLKQVICEEISNAQIRIIDSNNQNYAETFSDILARHIDNKIKPDFDVENFEPMHYLSHDEENDLLDIIRTIEGQSADQVKKCKEEISKSISKAQKLRKRLEASEKNNEVLLNYTNDLHQIKEQIGKLMLEKGKVEVYIDNLNKHLSDLEVKFKKAEESLKKARKDKSVFALCKSSHSLLMEFIPVLIEKKLDSVKEKFIFMFKQLIAKHDYIQGIDIDKDFNVTLYRQSLTSISMLDNMMAKIGVESFTNQMGDLCVKHLMNKLGISKKTELEKALSDCKENCIIELPVKVDINGFSKGEQQIYIMSLYWALVKMSNNNIPFVIDTPYARIDSAHRERITTKFFPSLSSQVLILSTDEEINNEYYTLIKPFISKEFLISYSDNDQCTNVEGKYFFEVAS